MSHLASSQASSAILAELRQQLAQLEGGSRSSDSSCISSGHPALDEILPDRGFAAGSLVEWVAADPGSGASLLALLAAREACRTTGKLLIIDRGRRFYPPAAVAWGILPEQLVLIHPANDAQQHWATLQALRCHQVAAVVVWLDRFDSRHARRMQLAAEATGVLGLIVREASAMSQPCWADLRCFVRPLPSVTAWRLQVELVRHRGSGLLSNRQVEIKL